MRVRSWVLLAGAVALAGCSDDGNGDQGPDTPPPTGDVRVRNNFFDPAELQVSPGTAVTWAWASNGVVHDVTFDDGQASPQQGDGTFERTFPAAGEFPYHCSIHGLAMSGVVSVAAPAGGGTATGTGDGGTGGPAPGGGGMGGY